jgi:hypothetical protein
MLELAIDVRVDMMDDRNLTQAGCRGWKPLSSVPTGFEGARAYLALFA